MSKSETMATGASQPAKAAQAPYRVEALPVMTPGQLGVFAVLTLAALTAIVLFAIHWWRFPDRTVIPGQFFFASALLAYQVVAWLLRWVALPRIRRPSAPPPPAPDLRVAAVTTFVPEVESLEMLELTLRALVAMDYPHDTWVLDEGDSTEVRMLCKRLDVRHFSRRDRPEFNEPTGTYAVGTKHGNYNAWLTAEGYERYDVVVSFDPDHVPEPHYLTRVLGYFQDPEIGYVQPPQVYYNQDASWIARGAAEETYDYYSSHQMASYGFGHPIVVGSHTAHRVAALREVGGFAAHDADDLLITILYRSAGWRGVYVPEVLAVGLTPTSWSVYMRQQTRWTRSVLDIKFRALREFGDKLPRIERAIGWLHGIFYLRPLTIPLAYLFLAWLIGTRGIPKFIEFPSLLTLLGFATVLTVIGSFRQRFYLEPDRERGFHWRALVLQFAKWPAQITAVIQAIRGKPIDYHVTLKVVAPSGREVVLWPHLAAAVLLMEAWIFGAILEPPVVPVRTFLAGIVVLGSCALAWSESWHYPPAFDARIYERYKAGRSSV